MFTRILRRNLIMNMIPILIIEVLTMFIVIQLGLLSAYSDKRINNITGLDMLYDEGVQNVTYICDDGLEYTGFDEQIDGKKVGGYYYTYDDKNNLTIFVLSDETISSLSKGQSIVIKGKLERDKVKSGFIESEISEKAGLGKDSLSGIVNPVFVNEFKYPFLRINIVKYASRVSVVIIILTVMYGILAFVCPWLIPGIEREGIKISKSKLIDILNEELSDGYETEDKHILITENYIIEAYISHVSVKKINQQE